MPESLIAHDTGTTWTTQQHPSDKKKVVLTTTTPLGSSTQVLLSKDWRNRATQLRKNGAMAYTGQAVGANNEQTEASTSNADNGTNPWQNTWHYVPQNR